MYDVQDFLYCTQFNPQKDIYEVNIVTHVREMRKPRLAEVKYYFTEGGFDVQPQRVF